MSKVAIEIPEGFCAEAGVQHLFWMVKVGDEVKPDKAVANAEAAKGVKFVMPPCAGTLDEIAVATGAAIEDGSIIGYIRTA